jgi:hypothetical protein
VRWSKVLIKVMSLGGCGGSFDLVMLDAGTYRLRGNKEAMCVPTEWEEAKWSLSEVLVSQ